MLDFTLVEKEVREISWLWDQWLPRGQLVLLAGAPGSGKTAIAISLVEIMLNGRNWPDGKGSSAGTPYVGWLNTENTEAVMLNRFKHHGIPLEKIRIPLRNLFKPLEFRNPDDRDFFTQEIRELAAAGGTLLVIDTLGGAFRGEENSKKEIEPFMQWLQGVARDTGVVILLLHHIRKRSDLSLSNEVSLDRVRGSTSITANARLVWIVEGDEENARVKVGKSNLGELPDPIQFRVEEGGAAFLGTYIESSEEDARVLARRFLREALSGGSISSLQLIASARAAGVSYTTLNRVKDDVGAVSRKLNGAWHWVIGR